MGDHEDENDLTKMPEAPAQEWGLVLAKSLASLIPFAGSPAAEVLGAIIAPQVEKRKTEWLENMRRDLNELSKRMSEVTPERLSQHPAFVTTFLQASQAAMRTHQLEKLQALRNIPLNVAAGTAPEDDLQLALIGLVEALTPCQMDLLRFFHDPQPFGIESLREIDYPKGPPKSKVLERVECLRGQSYLYEYYVDDLISRGLLQAPESLNPDMGGMMRIMAPRTTAIAQQLLAFITSPIPELDDADKPTH